MTSDPSEEPERVGGNVGGYFAFVPGFDAVAWGPGQYSAVGKAPPGTLVLTTVPLPEPPAAAPPLATLPLPGFVAAVDHGVCCVSAARVAPRAGEEAAALILVITNVHLYLARAARGDSGGGGDGC